MIFINYVSTVSSNYNKEKNDEELWNFMEFIIVELK